FDQVGGIRGSAGGVGDDQCNGLTHEAHLLVREHRAVRRYRLHAVLAGELHGMRRLGVAGFHRVFAGEDTLHALGGGRGLGIHRDDFRVRAVGAHEVTVKLAGLLPVGGIPARARDEPDVFYAFAVVMVFVVMGVGAHGSFLRDLLFGLILP